MNKELCGIILSAALLFALAILGPPASAQQSGFNPGNLSIDSIHSVGPDRCIYDQLNASDCDLLEFTHDPVGEETPGRNCHSGNGCPPIYGVVACPNEGNPTCGRESPAMPGDEPGENSNVQPAYERLRVSREDFNREVYYRNKLEFSLDGGWLPINIPFPLDVFVGDAYNTYPLKYTLVPIFASLRWHIDNPGSPWILRGKVLRGNWDLTLTGSVTAIPRGPESRYFSYIMGIRRNFVQRKWRVAPYFDVRLGVGRIDAKGPDGVKYAQGQDLTFTVNMGSGVRYNFNPRYAISAGLNFMHISNLDLSESNGKPNWGVRNYGINVYGPMVGIDIQLPRHNRHSE
ncbi:MAG TPA: acyloxyacyl hydrolase [Candidatus Sulfotelmatobacter sp.]